MRPKAVRSGALLLAVLLAAPAAAAQDDAPLNLPVSVERIREELAKPPRRSLLDAVDVTPHFRLTVTEQRPAFAEMFSLDDFKGGPVPPGGLYAYEQRRVLGQPAQVGGVDILPLFTGLAKAIGNARRARAEAGAREEVERAMAEFCAAQPNGGAGVVGCK